MTQDVGTSPSSALAESPPAGSPSIPLNASVVILIKL